MREIFHIPAESQRREENTPTLWLLKESRVTHLAVGSETREEEFLVVRLYHHLAGAPVDIPCLW